jgi:hypothetical protein
MTSQALESADLCLWLAGTAPPDQRRILLDLAAKWLDRGPRDAEWARLTAELSAWQRKPS